MSGCLYLVPTPLSDSAALETTPDSTLRLLDRILVFIVEDIRTARRYLKKNGIDINKEGFEFLEFNEHTDILDLSVYMTPLRSGKDVALLSEAGIPCVADPGAVLVREAHRLGIRVKPLSGPSSLFMALMASGLNGQQFHFHGYLPVDKQDRIRKLKDIERQMQHDSCTHFFIETPYRNKQLLDTLLQVCHPQTVLCMAVNISDNQEVIRTATLAEWKKGRLPEIHKVPVVFLLSGENHIK